MFAVENKNWVRVDELIEKEWASRQQAKGALSELGVKLPRKRTVKRTVNPSKVFLVLARLLNEDETMSAIARECGCSRQYVEQVKLQAVGAGIIFQNDEDRHEVKQPPSTKENQ